MSSKYTHFAVIQHGCAIFGVGSTPAEARKDAEEWLDNPEDARRAPAPPTQDQLDRGDLVVVPCTAALAALVREDGGQVPYDMDRDGGIDVASP